MFAIFNKLGGIEATLDVIQRRRGKRPGVHSVRSWMFYEKIPAINAVALMQECHDRGIPFDMSDCLLPKPRAPRRKRSSEGVAA